jgi:hypothetical protein
MVLSAIESQATTMKHSGYGQIRLRKKTPSPHWECPSSAFPSNSGGLTMLNAIRRASSAVNTFACRVSASSSRE